jgi:hypothetical protein
MTDMVSPEREDGSELRNNVLVYHANCSAQGHFQPAGQIMTQYQTNANGEYNSVGLKEEYTALFRHQQPNLDHVPFQTMIHNNHMNHPNTKVLLDRHVIFYNKKKKPKQFWYNKMFYTRTTWKYPEHHYNRFLHGNPQNEEEMPDRKVYFMIIATPLHGAVWDSGQDMHGFHMDPIDDELEDFTRKHQEGSVVSDLFGPAIVGPMLGSKGPKGVTCTGAGSLVFTRCRYVAGTVSS